jgi:hypothetical protein
MNIVLSKDSLSRVDQYRKARGIRTRKAAVEAMLAVVPVELEEHPLDVKLREARANPSTEKIPARIKKNLEQYRQEKADGTLETFTLSEVMDGIRRRERGN